MNAMLARCFSLRGVVRGLCWFILAAFLWTLGWSIYVILPHRPRWTLDGNLVPMGFFPGNSIVVFVEAQFSPDFPFKVVLIDSATGRVRRSIDMPGMPKFTADLRRGIASDGGEQLSGFDLVTGKTW